MAHGGDDGSPGALTHLRLLHGFELSVSGDLVAVPAGAQRLLAFLAIRGRPQYRSHVAASLWLDTSDDRAAGNLRSTLWRLRRVGSDVVETDGAYLRLSPHVDVDLTKAVAQADRVLSDASDGEVTRDDLERLAGDLLPDWSDDWVLIERERLRQVRLHALELLCVRLTAVGRHAHAIDAGLAAVAVEPLRESAHRAVIEAYLAEGNVCEAVRHLNGFMVLLRDNLGIAPSPALRRLVTDSIAASR